MFYGVLLIFSVHENNLYNLLKQNHGNNSRDFDLVVLGCMSIKFASLTSAQILKVLPGNGPYFEYNCFRTQILEIHKRSDISP